MTLFVGIDWAKEWNDFLVLDPQGKELTRFRLDQTAEGFTTAWQRLLGLAQKPGDVVTGIERPHGPLVEFLHAQGAVVIPLNPKAVDRARDRHRASRSKDDMFDAFVIADLLRTDGGRLQPLEPDSPLARELKGLSRGREDQVRQRTALVNKLHSSLTLFFPVAEKLFTDLYSDIALAFLTDFPTPAAVAKLTIKRWEKWLKSQSYTHPQRAKELYQLVTSKPLPADEVTVRVESARVRVLVRELRVVNQAVAEYDQAIERLYRQHPNHDHFDSLPSAGPTLGPKLAAELGGESVKRMTTEVLRAMAGTAPVTIASGKLAKAKAKALVIFRRACCKPMRQALHLFAKATVRSSRWAQAFAKYHLEHGHQPAETYRALADKWVKIIAAMLRTGRRYDEAVYIRAVAGRAPWAMNLQPAEA